MKLYLVCKSNDCVMSENFKYAIVIIFYFVLNLHLPVVHVHAYAHVDHTHHMYGENSSCTMSCEKINYTVQSVQKYVKMLLPSNVAVCHI